MVCVRGDYTIHENVIEEGVRSAGTDDNEAVVFVFQFSALHIVDIKILKNDVMQRALVATHEDPVFAGTRDIQGVDLPVLLIEEQERLTISARGYDTRARPVSIGRNTDGMIGYARAPRRERSTTSSASRESDAVSRGVGMGLSRGKRIPRMGR